MTPARANPYIGPRAFQSGETLYGRDREIAELLDLLIAERIVLLYSPSGAGKTSLVRAGLIPALEREGFMVLPLLRVNLEPRRTFGGELKVANRYVLSLLLSLEEERPAGEQLPLAELAGMDLGVYLERRAAAGADQGMVLVFDQFEEIVTLDQTDWAAKEQFFDQAGAVLRDRRRWALFAMREDFLAGLDPYARRVPTRFNATYRLDLLGAAAAAQAIQGPAQAAGVEFTDAATRKLVDDLRRVRVQTAEGALEERPGPYVEPVQLQVVCYRLWEKLPPDAPRIVESDVETVGDVDSALGAYYAERVQAVSGATGVRESAIRDWCGGELITEQGFRGQVLQGPERSGNLDNRAIWPLVDAHLVRAEKRRGATWFELAHDRLIEPVRRDNAAWHAAHASVLRRQAELWISQGKREGMLLRDQALEEAERWAQAHADELTPVDNDYLEASRDLVARERDAQRKRDLEAAQRVAEAERLRAEEAARAATQLRRRAVFLTSAVILAALLAIAALALWGVANQNAQTAAANARAAQAASTQAVAQQRTAEANATQAVIAQSEAQKQQATAEAQYRLALARELASDANTNLSADPQLAALLAMRAVSTTYLAGQGVLPEAEDALHRAVQALTQSPAAKVTQSLPVGSRDVVAVLFTPDGRALLTGSRKGDVTLWDTASGKMVMVFPEGASGLTSLALSPDGRTIAVGSAEGLIALWDFPSGKPLRDPLIDRTGGVNTVAFSLDGRYLASGSSGGAIQIWDVESGEPLIPWQAGFQLPGHKGGVNSVAFSPDGRRLASGGADAIVRLWDLGTLGRQLVQSESLEGHTAAVNAVSFSPDGRMLASGGDDAAVILWDVATARPLSKPLQWHSQAVTSVAFSRDGAVLASGSADMSVMLWDVWKGRPLGEPLTYHKGAVNTVQFSPDGMLLAAGAADGTASLWAFSPSGGGEYPAAIGHADSVISVAYSPDGALLATAGQHDEVRVWDVESGQLRGNLQTGLVDVNALAFSPDGSALAIGGCGQRDRDNLRCVSGEIQFWDAAKAAPLGVPLRDPKGTATCLAFSPDGALLASGRGDEAIAVWDVQRADLVGEPMFGGGGAVYVVAFTLDGKLLASGSADGTVRLWDPRGGDAVSKLQGHTDAVFSLAVDHTGSVLASGGVDGDVWLWDVAHGQPLGDPMRGHAGAVYGLIFNEDGTRLITAGGDGKVKVWDVSTRQESFTLASGVAAITSLALNPAMQLAAAGADGAVRLYALNVPELVRLASERVERRLSQDECQQYLHVSQCP